MFARPHWKDTDTMKKKSIISSFDAICDASMMYLPEI